MKARKVKALLLAAVMVMSTALMGCGGSEGQENGTDNQETAEEDAGKEETAKGDASEGEEEGDVVEVSYWALSTQQDYYEPVVEAFHEENKNIKVNISYYDTDGMKDACKVAASSDTLPNMWFNFGGSLGGFYVDNGLTYNLNDYAEANGWSEHFNENALALCTYDGVISGHPNGYSILGVFYRKDLFEQCGVEVPATFEEFEEVCDTLKANGITPMYAGGLNGWHVMRYVELLIEHYAGADAHDQMNTFDKSYDDENVTKAFEKYKEWVDKGYFPDGFVTMDANDTLMPLSTGECAMTMEGQWQDSNIVKNGLDMDQYGAFAFPSGGSNRLSSFADMTQFNAKNTEEELDACVTFLDYYFSHVLDYTDSYGLPMPTLDSPMPEGQPNVGNLIKLGQENGTFTITDQAFPTEVADVLFNCQDAIANGEMEPAQAGAEIQAAIEAYNNK